MIWVVDSADQARLEICKKELSNLLEQEKLGKRIGAVLIELGFVTDSIIRDALSENTGYSTVDITGTVIDADAIIDPLELPDDWHRQNESIEPIGSPEEIAQRREKAQMHAPKWEREMRKRK